MDKEQWLKNRVHGIGGSEAGSILGKSNFMTNIELWEYKTGKKTPKDISEVDRVKYGTKAERPLIELFILDFPEYEVIYKDHEAGEFDSKVHSKYEFLMASLDGELIEKETGRKGILEVKTVVIDRYTDWQNWDNRIPEAYFIQCIHNMNVAGADFFVLKVKIRHTDKYGMTTATIRHYKMNRNECQEDIDYLQNKEIEFWNYVETDVMPSLILPSI